MLMENSSEMIKYVHQNFESRIRFHTKSISDQLLIKPVKLYVKRAYQQCKQNVYGFLGPLQPSQWVEVSLQDSAPESSICGFWMLQSSLALVSREIPQLQICKCKLSPNRFNSKNIHSGHTKGQGPRDFVEPKAYVIYIDNMFLFLSNKVNNSINTEL